MLNVKRPNYLYKEKMKVFLIKNNLVNIDYINSDYFKAGSYFLYFFYPHLFHFLHV